MHSLTYLLLFCQDFVFVIIKFELFAEGTIYCILFNRKKVVMSLTPIASSWLFVLNFVAELITLLTYLEIRSH
jgi:hypothetical protein